MGSAALAARLGNPAPSSPKPRLGWLDPSSLLAFQRLTAPREDQKLNYPLQPRVGMCYLGMLATSSFTHSFLMGHPAKVCMLKFMSPVEFTLDYVFHLYPRPKPWDWLL